jgi:hypothetical protein
MIKTATLTAGLLVFCAIAGCDDDNSSGSNHGVEGNKEIDTLSQKELDSICGDARRREIDTAAAVVADQDYVPAVCTALGLVAASVRGTITECEKTRDRCIAAVNQTTADSGILAVGCPSAVGFLQCEALVADIDACTSAVAAAIEQPAVRMNGEVEGLSCANAGKPIDLEWFSVSGTVDVAPLDTLPECASLLQQCPSAALLY